MNAGKWRNPKPKKCKHCHASWPTERQELVERVIRAERANRELKALLATMPIPEKNESFDLDRMLDAWRTHGVPGVRADLVEQNIAVTRRSTRAAIEALGQDPAEVRALVLDRQTVTVVKRDERSVRLLILEDQ